MLLVILCEAEANTTVNNCVSDYEEFEGKTFGITNKGNRYKLYDVFYPSNGNLPYAVEVTYRAVLPNGAEYKITIYDGYCTIAKWRWISSPLFLFSRTRIWNAVVLGTLNYFRPWTTPSVILHVPSPCKNTTVVFLARMTSLVSLVSNTHTAVFNNPKDNQTKTLGNMNLEFEYFTAAIMLLKVYKFVSLGINKCSLIESSLKRSRVCK